jgi:thymidine kinase
MYGRLIYVYGAMGSAKTAELLIEAYAHEEKGFKVCCIKPQRDTRDKTIKSRAGDLEREADFLVTPDDDLFELIPDDVDSLFVDEVQFLTPEQIDQLRKLTIDKQMTVLTYGLRADFQTNGFPGSIRLFEIADEIREKYYNCKCHGKATYNARFLNGEIVVEGDQVAIEGEDGIQYNSVCPECYYRLRDEQIKKQQGPVRIRKKDLQ